MAYAPSTDSSFFTRRGLVFLIIVAIHVGMAFSWHLAWALAGATLARVLSRRRPRQVLDVVTGIALLILAITVAL